MAAQKKITTTIMDGMDDNMSMMLMSKMKKNTKKGQTEKISDPPQEPISADEMKDFAIAAVQSLFAPLTLFARRCVERENCKAMRIGVPEGVRPKYFRFFLIDGKEHTAFSFSMNARLYDQKGRSVSFAELCFGPQKSGSQKFSERDFEAAWFNKLGLGFQYSPIFQLTRLIDQSFQKKLECQMVLTMTTLPARGDHAEGVSALEFVWDRSVDETLRLPKSNWLKYSKADSKFSHLLSDFDEVIEKTLGASGVLENFKKWSCTDDLQFGEEVSTLREEITDLQAKQKAAHESRSRQQGRKSKLNLSSMMEFPTPK